MFTIEPTDHWRAGDRAYCLRGLKHEGRHILEKGRVYAVTEVKTAPSMMTDGLRLAGVCTGEMWGFHSSRFACLRGQAPLASELRTRLCPRWRDAYHECAAARSAIAYKPEPQT